jgi:hypothetical protein
MDWMESFVTMNMTAEFIFYFCLSLIVQFYLPRLVHQINPSVKITAECMPPAIFMIIVISHRFNWTFASTTTDLKLVLLQHICLWLLSRVSIPHIIHWINPSSNINGELFLIPILVFIIEVHHSMRLSELEPSQGSLEVFAGTRTLARKMMSHIMNGSVSYN